MDKKQILELLRKKVEAGKLPEEVFNEIAETTLKDEEGGE